MKESGAVRGSGRWGTTDRRREGRGGSVTIGASTPHAPGRNRRSVAARESQSLHLRSLRSRSRRGRETPQAVAAEKGASCALAIDGDGPVRRRSGRRRRARPSRDSATAPQKVLSHQRFTLHFGTLFAPRGPDILARSAERCPRTSVVRGRRVYSSSCRWRPGTARMPWPSLTPTVYSPFD